MGHHRKLCSILFNTFVPAVFLSEAGLYCGSAQRELGCDWLICLTTPFCPLKTWSISIQHSDRSRTFNFLNEVRMVLLPGLYPRSAACVLKPLSLSLCQELSYHILLASGIPLYQIMCSECQPGVYEHREHQDRSECCQRCCYCLMCPASKQNRVSSPELQERLLRTSEISHRR